MVDLDPNGNPYTPQRIVREAVKTLRNIGLPECTTQADRLESIAASLEGVRVSVEDARWSYCPECGSDEVRHEEGTHKQCAVCHQEWFSDVDYTEVVRSHLADRLRTAIEQGGEK